MDMLHDTNFWVITSFTIFAVGALKFGRRMILGKLDDRIETIRKDIETAENLRIEAQELLAQYQRKQRDVNAEATSMIEKAQESAEAILAEAETEMKETAARREAQLQERLARMEQQAIVEIRARAAELAVQATQEIIQEKMDKKTNDNLVNESIKSIASSLK